MHDHDLSAAALARADTLTRKSLVLYAGANRPSGRVLAAYAPGLAYMPAMGPSEDKEQPGTRIVSALEIAIRERAKALFGAGWAEPRLSSATLCNLAVFHALARPADLMLAPAAMHGGHLSQRRGGTPDLAGLRVEELPFDGDNLQLDAAAAARMVERLKPRLVMLGRSVMLQPDDVAPVTRAAAGVGAITIFDASHVAGLIAGGTYPNPLDEGADILTMSTYKTLPGRPHGLLVGRDEAHGRAIADLLDRAFLANSDAGKLPQLLVLLEETARGGTDYAARISANTARLGTACRARGFAVRIGAARHTHQLLLPITETCDPRRLIRDLAEADVVVGTAPDISRAGGAALRVGTQFLTTLGLGEEAMEETADLLADLLAMQQGCVSEVRSNSCAATSEKIHRILNNLDPNATALLD